MSESCLRSTSYIDHLRYSQIYSTESMDSQKDVQPPKQQPMIYICGECHTENEIKARDPIRCRECGYRIMYKKRTKRLVVFDAR
ncbi:DNA-directed RNA polymerases I, II, and III subunit RPABC4 isoform X1 [Dermochelys coriacea]|uniref:DNA-directed RNA polymerases I, II, and III subunit RPABC4 isoform X1 n=1 Tax=Dermochelys coriacea TaxID=27794 RepID=UPI001CA9459B|nr:DNA-directed RNA polymerases I, II, and III subunit RPABC4 isoform X1 [Dermochelys coriacea]XP_043363463.1 DNA-directed RNA polymerases I, II, and III subunit RPABC4 isoform X1 [Dermochelys coriacea]